MQKNTIELNSLIVDGFNWKSQLCVRQAWFNYSVTMTLGTMYIAWARMKVNSKIVRKWFYFDCTLCFALSFSITGNF